MKSTTFLLIAFLSFSITAISVPNKQLPTKGTGPWVVNVYYENRQQLLNYTRDHSPWRHDTEKQYKVNTQYFSCQKNL